MNIPDIHQSIENNRQSILKHFYQFLQMPSISANPENKNDLHKTAQWLVSYCQSIGFKTQLLQTPGAPVVFAEHCPFPDKPILLIYGHYDIQPVDPISEWMSPPFSPKINGNMIYARGASDDKGQVFSFLKAIEFIYFKMGTLPVNLKIVIEGEEEIGCINFEDLLVSHSDLMHSDSVIIMDALQYAQGIPALTYGLRGQAYFQITCNGAFYDLHSGHFGGGIPNPAFSLIKILSQLKNEYGKITIPGFYENVMEPEPWEREQMASLPFQEETLKKEIGIKSFIQEKNYTSIESMRVRPTFDICGIWGGYSGLGSKTIIPSRCNAKISFRLVPNQTTQEIFEILGSYLKTIVPLDIDYQVEFISRNEPLLSDPKQPLFRNLSTAIKNNFDREPVLIRGGCSVGVAYLFKKFLKTDSICITGWGSPEDGIHSPNEHLSLKDFFRGIHTMVDFLFEYSASN